MAVTYVSEHEFNSARYIDGVNMEEFYKQVIVDNKPTNVGTSILDLSKLNMLMLHCVVIQKNSDGRHNVMYRDTA